MKCPTELLGEQRRWQCPCCDYFSLPVRGQYDICPICGWEDDGLDLDRPDEASGPNHATLREARAVFEQTGGNVDVSHYERRPRRVGAAKPC